jgi:hypothetical protein
MALRFVNTGISLLVVFLLLLVQLGIQSKLRGQVPLFPHPVVDSLPTQPSCEWWE